MQIKEQVSPIFWCKTKLALYNILVINNDKFLGAFKSFSPE
jgi:hypothetical protein